MTKQDKLIIKILTEPKIFSWQELRRLLSGFGYRETQSGKTSGSRVRFIHDKHEPISLHKPHPNPHLKPYQIRQIAQMLKDRGEI